MPPKKPDAAPVTKQGGIAKNRLAAVYSKPSNSIRFPQAPLFWQAYVQAAKLVQVEPTPANRLTAAIMAERWRCVFLQGGADDRSF